MDFRYFLKGLLLPPVSQIIFMLLAWRFRGRWPKLARTLFIFTILSLWVLGMPVAAALLSRTLERDPALDPDRLTTVEADAIVVLSARQLDTAPEFGHPVSGAEALARIRYGAFLHRKTGLPVLLSGGSVRGLEKRSLAETMAYDLQEGYGIEARWLEMKSRTTMENATVSHTLLAPEGKTSIILVTSADHMMRARWAFERAGFKVLAAPTGAVDKRPLTINSFLPSARGLNRSVRALHEWLGYWVYQLQGSP